ncbi:hypothetical protein POTOM_059787 [Populus tomentosa]|uniref:dUTP diphosphatase n=1 Tax=Populus tomentosa TaxID=118781 RepID=A0A8X7XNY3_POPTO|nr:hypothetical protein POTOM_059787 [Populus tomentosa]
MISPEVLATGNALIPIDLSIAIPEGTYACIALRLGLAWKHLIDMGVGLIDADYRGPVGVITLMLISRSRMLRLTGWPYKRDDNDLGPSIGNAKVYTGNLIAVIF